jgi:exopolysaccharide biosynthesis WecB/TagA/CpsF family protein
MKLLKFLEIIRVRLAREESEVIDCSEGTSITFLNPYSYLVMRAKCDLMSKFSKVCIDGSVLVLALKVFRVASVKRISFDYTSIAHQVFNRCVEQKKSLYIVGATEECVGKFVSHLKGSYVGLNMAGFRNGYFSNAGERADFIRELVALNPQVVVVGMGTPLQEELIIDLRASGWGGVGYTCGGFLHQTASRGGRYYPSWLNRLGLRFLYRMYDEPKLVKRYLEYYPKFVIRFVRDRFEWRKSAGDA